MKKRSKKSGIPKKNNKELASFLLYIGIGAFVMLIDLSIFHILLTQNIYRPFATSISYLTAITIHFFLNKFLNFKSFKRSTFQQMLRYIIVACVCWLTTVIVIEFCVEIINISDLLAKIIGILINVPVSFLGHRYFTFTNK
ncbi:MAG: GtrA family protein [Cyanobacterium sp.]